MEVDLQIENELKDNLVILTTKEKTKNIQDIVSYIKTRRYFKSYVYWWQRKLILLLKRKNNFIKSIIMIELQT